MTMKVSLISDIHLECTNPYDIVLDDSDVLILGGDILNLSILLEPSPQQEKYRQCFCEFLSKVSAHYDHVIYIAGNHEYYAGTFMSMIPETQEFFDQNYGNVYFLENELKVIDGVGFLGSTLWTDMLKENRTAMEYIAYALNDYRTIQSAQNQFRITPEETVQYHKHSLEKLDSILREAAELTPELPIVMCTHHAPLEDSTDAQYVGSMINEAFYSDLSEFMQAHKNIKVWTHGHMHNLSDYVKHDIRVICNPRGYDHERSTEIQPKQFGV